MLERIPLRVLVAVAMITALVFWWFDLSVAPRFLWRYESDRKLLSIPRHSRTERADSLHSAFLFEFWKKGYVYVR